MTKNKTSILAIALLSLICNSIAVYFFHQKNLNNEWSNLIANYENFKIYSYFIFEDFFVPSSYMPPLYFAFIYLNKVLSLGLFNYIYLIYFNQIILSTLSVLAFYKFCSHFVKSDFALLGTIIFSFFPLIIYSTTLISSATLQIFLYLITFNSFLDLINGKKKFFKLSFLSGLCLLLRGEFLVIFVFSLIIISFLKKNFFLCFKIFILTCILISPYLLRNYINTEKIHIVNVTGYALWKGNNHLSNVEGYHNPLFPLDRDSWPEIEEFKKLYNKLDEVKIDNKYEINRDRVFFNEAKENILSNKKKYFILFIKKIFSLYFIDLNSSNQNYYNFFHIIPVMLISTLSFIGVFVILKNLKYQKKNQKYKLIYILSISFILLLVLSIFSVLPRYKLSILAFQILFSIFTIKFLMKIKKI